VKRRLVIIDGRNFRVRKQLIRDEPVGDIFGSEPITFTPDGVRAIAAHGEAIVVWDVESERREASWGSDLNEVAFSPDARVALARKSGYQEGEYWERYEAFELDGGHSLGVFDSPHPHDSRMLPVDSQRLYLLVLSDGAVGIHDLRSGEEWIVPDITAKETRDFNGAVSGDGQVLAIGLREGGISMWNLPAMTMVRQRTGTGASVRAVRFSPDGAALAFSADDRLCVWHFEPDHLTCVDVAYPMGIGDIEFAPDSRALTTTGLMIGPRMKLWEVGR